MKILLKITKRLPRVALAFATSATALTVIQPPISWSPLAWVSLVPFVLVCSPAAEPKSLAVVAYIVSLCYWLGNLYWIAPVTISGWSAFCLYTALLWPILALCLRYIRTKKLPLFITVPVLFVGAERLQGLFLGGFFWRHLSHSQYANITLIQISDIFGAAGLSFLVAMVNGLLAELILAVREKCIFKISNLLKTSLVCAALAGTIVYGRWRIGQSDEFIEFGPLVACVQSNVPQSVKESGQVSEQILDELLHSSSESAAAGAELIVWPETMVPATLDQRVLSRLDGSYHCRIVDEQLRRHSKDTAYILVGAYGGVLETGEDLTIRLARRYNSSFLYTPDGRQADRQYNKIHLVPFGEVVPFKKSIPRLYNLLMKFTPYDYDYSLDAGNEYTVFEMAGGQNKKERIYRFGVMICYEDTIPAIARRFAMSAWGCLTADGGRQKRLGWLINISNDGWFVKFENEKVLPSTELAQHTAVCVFRAVENRLAVLRSVNTGISCLIDTAGRIKDGFIAGNLPSYAMARTGVTGWFADKVPIDKRTTFFCRYGQWLDFCCAAALILVIILQLSEQPRTKLRGKKYTGAAG